MTDLLGIGQSGLSAAQVVLNTAGNNIANVNTPGYTRRTTQLAQVVNGSGQGGGVVVAGVEREYSRFVATQLNDAQAAAGAANGALGQLSQIDSLMGDGSTGLAPSLQDFFDSVSAWANTPSDPVARGAVLDAAQNLASQFNSLSQSLQQIGAGASQQLAGDIAQVNRNAAQIAALNRQIVLAQGQGLTANQLLDQRDQLVADTSKLVKLAVVENDDGSYSITVGGQSLVDATGSHELELAGNASAADPAIRIDTSDLGGITDVPLGASATGIVTDGTNYYVATDDGKYYPFDPRGSVDGKSGKITLDLDGASEATFGALSLVSDADSPALQPAAFDFADLSGITNVPDGASAMGIVTDGTDYYVATSDGEYYRFDPDLAIDRNTGRLTLDLSGETPDAVAGAPDPVDATNGPAISAVQLEVDDLSGIKNIPGGASATGVVTDGANYYVATSDHEYYRFDPDAAADRETGKLTLDLTNAAGLPQVPQPVADTSGAPSLGLGYVGADGVVRTIASSAIGGGEISGLIAFSADSLAPALERLDDIAQALADAVNAQQNAGYVDTGSGASPSRGEALFKYDANSPAATLSVNISDPGGLAAALPATQNGMPDTTLTPGNNRNALAMAALQDRALAMSRTGGTSSVFASYAQLVGQVGSKVQALQAASTTQGAVVSELTQAQQSISGVNLDEEYVNLTYYQQMYQASARVISVASTLFDTLLSLGN